MRPWKARKTKLTARGGKSGLNIEWWPLLRFGRHPRWALWLEALRPPGVSDG